MTAATSTFRGRIVTLAVGAAISFQATPASAGTTLADAIQRWYRTDPAIVCVSPEGRPRRCPPSDDLTTSVNIDPAGTAAIVFLTWLTDPTGNATGTSAAVFREGATGWQLARRLPGIQTQLEGKVRFSGDTAAFTVGVFRPSDGRFAPSGRKSMRVKIR